MVGLQPAVAGVRITVSMPVRRHALGEETRGRIMVAIRERQAVGRPPFTVRGLARALKMDHAGILRHLGTLVECGDLERREVAEGVIVYQLPSKE